MNSCQNRGRARSAPGDAHMHDRPKPARSRPLCREFLCDFLPVFPMVDTKRQVPPPSAHAWSVDLADVGGPTFTVLRTSADEAREAVVAYLVEIGSGLTWIAATDVVSRAAVSEVSVVW